MSNKSMKSEYISPQVEILEARVECGFQASGYSGSSTESIGSGSGYGANSFSPVAGGSAEGVGSGNSYDGAMFS